MAEITFVVLDNLRLSRSAFLLNTRGLMELIVLIGFDLKVISPELSR